MHEGQEGALSERSAAMESDVGSQSERKLKDTLVNFHKQVSFNYENFANATENILKESYFPPGVDPESPAILPSPRRTESLTATTHLMKKAKYILTDSQRKRWNEIIKNVPQMNRVYI